jgi:hypothetical protein
MGSRLVVTSLDFEPHTPQANTGAHIAEPAKDLWVKVRSRVNRPSEIERDHFGNQNGQSSQQVASRPWDIYVAYT